MIESAEKTGDDNTTPASSPPSEGQDGKMEDAAIKRRTLPGVSDAMEEEERRMQELSKQEDESRDQKFRKERRKDLEGGQEGVNSKFKALEYLLSQSKVCTSAFSYPFRH